ncbi:MAG: AcvB/VirJ family lysyl-phosphatidylglycerol hydrolase [Gemmatimonadaceae bacterium]
MTRAHFGMAVWLLAVACSPVVPTSAAQGASAGIDVKGLPLNFIAPKGNASHYVALVMTGDGGFASLVTKLSDGLSDAGIGVVGFNSREWLSPAKTPDASAAAAVRAIRAGMARYHADSIVIVGYSRGADLAPFVGNRLPADLRSVLGGIAMFGMATYSNFEFHLIDLVKDTKRDSDVPILPELLKLKGVPMVCVYGSDEKESGCREVPQGLMAVDKREGGHHFDGADQSLADVVLKLLHPSR